MTVQVDGPLEERASAPASLVFLPTFCRLLKPFKPPVPVENVSFASLCSPLSVFPCHCSDRSDVNLLRRAIVIEEPHQEVADQVRDEERPVVLRHRLRRVVDVVDGVDPHVPRVVQEVHRDADVELGKQVAPVSGIERPSDRLLAEDANFIKIAASLVE